MTGLVFLLVAQGMRHLYHWRLLGISILRPLVWAIPIVYVGWLIVFLAGGADDVQPRAGTAP